VTAKAASPNKVINNYLIIAGLYTLAASLIWGVNTLFLLDAGLDIREVFLANAAFTAGMALFEIPTGVVADTVGRRVSFLLSVAILFLSTWGYIVVAQYNGSLWLFVIVSVVMGLGFTFYSGAVEAWLVDALNFNGFSGNLDQVFARGAIISGAAMILGTIGGGLLGSMRLDLPYVLRSFFLATVFIVAFATMKDVGYVARPLTRKSAVSEIRKLVSSSLQHGWYQQPVRYLMIIAFIKASFFTWAFYAWQPYFLDLLGEPESIWIAGLIAAAISLAMMAGNSLVEKFATLCTKRTTLIFWAVIVQALAAVGVGLSRSFPAAVIFVLIMMAASGVSSPVIQAYMHRIIPGSERATIISFNSMIGSAGGIAGQSALGQLAQTRSIASGYFAGGIFTLFALPITIALRKLEDTADGIEEMAGTRSACAAQGLPAVAAVDPEKATV
jgi:MFS family permease